MTDQRPLSERLRLEAESRGRKDDNFGRMLLTEAANRLDRLERALQQIAEHSGDRGQFTDEEIWERIPSQRDIAMSALSTRHGDDPNLSKQLRPGDRQMYCATCRRPTWVWRRGQEVAMPDMNCQDCRRTQREFRKKRHGDDQP